MSQIEKVLHDHRAAKDGVDADVIPSVVAVDVDQRNSILQRLVVLFRAARAGHDQAVDFQSHKQVDGLSLSRLEAAGIDNQNPQVVLRGLIFDALAEVSEKRIGHVGDDDTDKAAASVNQGLGGHAGHVAQLRCDADDLLSSGDLDSAAALQRSRHRRRVDARLAGDILDGGPAGRFVRLGHALRVRRWVN